MPKCTSTPSRLFCCLGFQRQLHARRGFATHHAVAVVVGGVVGLSLHHNRERQKEEVSDGEQRHDKEELEDKRERTTNDGKEKERFYPA